MYMKNKNKIFQTIFILNNKYIYIIYLYINVFYIKYIINIYIILYKIYNFVYDLLIVRINYRQSTNTNVKYICYIIK